jgi:hypothetical protein
MVIDHTSYAVSETEGDHTLIASDDFIKADVILGGKKIEASARSGYDVTLPVRLFSTAVLIRTCFDAILLVCADISFSMSYLMSL